MNFEKFDELVNSMQLQKEIESASQATYEDVPAGTYITKIEKMEVKPTKAGDKLMFSVQMKIVETIDAPKKQDGRWIFWNRIIFGNRPNAKGTWNDGVAIKGVMTWLEKLDSGMLIEFKNYSDFSDLVEQIMFTCSNTTEIEVKYEPDAFNSVTITNVYDV